MGNVHPMAPGMMLGGGGMPPAPTDAEIAEQRRFAAVQLAIGSLTGSEYTDDALIERARRISAFVKNGGGSASGGTS